MAVYKDSKRNTYYARFRINGRQCFKRGFPTRQEAEKFEYNAKYQEVNPTYIRFKDLVEEYRNEYKRNVTYGTYARTGIFFEHFIFPNFPNKYLYQITELDCLKFKNYLDTIEKSTSYKNDILGTFKGVFKHAEMYYGLKNNPSANLKRFIRTREEKIKRKKLDMNIWTNEEFNAFINCVNSKLYEAIFMTLFYTGMRKGECLALTWNDLLDHKINVDKSLTRKTDLEDAYEIKEPKNVSSIREISINDGLYNYLLDYKVAQTRIPGFSEDWFIFGGLHPVAENTLTRAKDAAIEKAGVRRIHIHDFRHSHASNLIADGMNIVAVSRRLGHSDPSMTLQIYTHLIKRNEDELVKNIENSFIHINKV